MWYGRVRCGPVLSGHSGAVNSQTVSTPIRYDRLRVKVKVRLRLQLMLNEFLQSVMLLGIWHAIL